MNIRNWIQPRCNLDNRKKLGQHCIQPWQHQISTCHQTCMITISSHFHDRRQNNAHFLINNNSSWLSHHLSIFRHSIYFSWSFILKQENDKFPSDSKTGSIHWNSSKSSWCWYSKKKPFKKPSWPKVLFCVERFPVCSKFHRWRRIKGAKERVRFSEDRCFQGVWFWGIIHLTL